MSDAPNSDVPFAKMNGLGNQIIVADMRGHKDKIAPAAAIALAGDQATHFDQIMAIVIHVPMARTPILILLMLMGAAPRRAAMVCAVWCKRFLPKQTSKHSPFKL